MNKSSISLLLKPKSLEPKVEEIEKIMSDLWDKSCSNCYRKDDNISCSLAIIRKKCDADNISDKEIAAAIVKYLKRR